MDKEVVKELIQQDLTVFNVAKELELVLTNPLKQAQLNADYTALKDQLSQGGNASANAAKVVYEMVR
jgi:lipid-A-disaccharide synthase